MHSTLRTFPGELEQAVAQGDYSAESLLQDWGVHWAPIGMSLRICISYSPPDTIPGSRASAADWDSCSLYIPLLVNIALRIGGGQKHWLSLLFVCFFKWMLSAQKETGTNNSLSFKWLLTLGEKGLYASSRNNLFAASNIKWDYLFALVISIQRA